MLDILSKLFGVKPRSASVAKNRLQLVLAQERLGLSEERLFQLKQELCSVISKYFEFDNQTLEIEILKREGHRALTVKTPLNSSIRS